MESQSKLHEHHRTSKHQNLHLSPLFSMVQAVPTDTLLVSPLTSPSDIRWLVGKKNQIYGTAFDQEFITFAAASRHCCWFNNFTKENLTFVFLCSGNFFFDFRYLFQDTHFEETVTERKIKNIKNSNR